MTDRKKEGVESIKRTFDFFSQFFSHEILLYSGA